MAEGRLVLVVGPSGAGKDTLIDFARARLGDSPNVLFVRRAITRPPSTGEDHEPVSESAFLQRAAEGGFALHWHAHGLFYGIPAAIDEHLEQGAVVIANVSRAILPEARRRYPALLVVNVTATPAILAKRLAARGRESESALRERLARGDRHVVEGGDVRRIDNIGAPEDAGEALVALLRSLVPRALLSDGAPG